MMFGAWVCIYTHIYTHTHIWTSKVALVVKNLADKETVREVGLFPGSGRSPGGGHGNPLQCSCLENPMDRGAWRAAVHGVAESGMTEQPPLTPLDKAGVTFSNQTQLLTIFRVQSKSWRVIQQCRKNYPLKVKN